MPLDPQLKRYLEENRRTMPPIDTMTPQQIRSVVRSMFPSQVLGYPEEVASIEERQIPVNGGEITIRIYTPDGDKPFPMLVYFHGGGFVVGDLEMADPLSRQITNRARCIVVSVAYRLAPEHPFPASVEDGYAALRWVAENATTLNGDPSRIAVGGDSAGGNIATVATLMARDNGGPRVRLQVLLYPPVDFVTKPPVTDSVEDAMADYLHSMYFVSESDCHHAYASPALAANVSGLPKALILTAELDRLRDEGERYATKLREAGVPVDYVCYEGLTHGFAAMLGVLDKAKDSVQRISMALKTAFGTAQA